MALSPFSTLQEINKVLLAFQITGWKVHPRVVEFGSKEDKAKKATMLSTQMKKYGNPEDLINMMVEECCDGDTVTEGIRSMTQQGSIVMVCGDFERDNRNKISLDEKKLHVHLLFLKERKVSVYSFIILIY
jgi:hypothetical protein